MQPWLKFGSIHRTLPIKVGESSMETKLKVGDKVTCDKFASLTHDFVGTIEKIYENSAVVEIVEHHKDDNIVVSDFHDRAVVALDHMKKVSA